MMMSWILYLVPHFRYAAFIWLKNGKTKQEEIIRLYNSTIKTALNIPEKTPNEFMKKFLGTWSFQAIIEKSYAMVSEKWLKLYSR